MSRVKIIAAWIMAMTAAALGQTQPTSTAPATGVAIDLKDARAVADLQKRLASEDFATREEGQRQLATVSMKQLEDLRNLSRQAADPELQARLAMRVEEMDFDRLMNPPGYSMNFKDLPLDKVAAELAKVTGAPIIEPTRNLNPAGETYSLKVENQPFWEIIRQLNLQHDIWLTQSGQQVQLVRDTSGFQEQLVRGGTTIFLDKLRRVGVARAGARAGAVAAGPAIAAAQLRYSWAIAVGVDPRIKVLEVGPAVIDPVVDDAKVEWTIVSTSSVTKPTGPAFFWMRTISLQVPVAWGRTIPAVTGKVTLQVQMPENGETKGVTLPFAFKDLPIPP